MKKFQIRLFPFLILAIHPAFGLTVRVPATDDPVVNGENLLHALEDVQGVGLIRLDAGIYDLAGEALRMKPGVSLEGSGQRFTRIVSTGAPDHTSATVVTADGVVLSRLTIESTGGDESAVAILALSAATRIEHVTAIGRGGFTLNYGLRIVGAGVRLADVEAAAEGGAFTYAVSVRNVESIRLADVTAEASGDGENHAVFVINELGPPEMEVDLDRVSAEAWGGTASHGLRLRGESKLRISGSALRASGADLNFGLSTSGIFPVPLRIDGSKIEACGEESYGVHVSRSSISKSGPDDSLPFTVMVDRSEISGETRTLWGDYGASFFVGSSRLAGGPATTELGTVRCAGAYDEDYELLDDACQNG